MKKSHPIALCLALALTIFSSCVEAGKAGKAENSIIAEFAGFSDFGEVSLLSMNLGAETEGSHSGGGGATTFAFKSLTITRHPDSFTEELFALLTTSGPITGLVITQGNMRYAFANLVVSEYDAEGHADPKGHQIETWVLDFQAINILSSSWP